MGNDFYYKNALANNFTPNVHCTMTDIKIHWTVSLLQKYIENNSTKNVLTMTFYYKYAS